MSAYYSDYKWKNGIPYGINKCSPQEVSRTYKVISDPYYKRISVEEYEKNAFKRVIYDSALFDFRHLRPDQQMAWEKKTITPFISHIHNQDDRLVFIEEYTFQEALCRSCSIRSPHGIHLATQRMFYTSLKDSFNGVILFDSNNYPVIKKCYLMNGDTFEDLQSESWEVAANELSPCFS